MGNLNPHFFGTAFDAASHVKKFARGRALTQGGDMTLVSDSVATGDRVDPPHVVAVRFAQPFQFLHTLSTFYGGLAIWPTKLYGWRHVTALLSRNMRLRSPVCFCR